MTTSDKLSMSTFLTHHTFMLEKISFIASVICGLTSLTTTLRALGRSREIERDEKISRAAESHRLSEGILRGRMTQSRNLRLYFAVTLIWYALSLFFAVPLFLSNWKSEKSTALAVWLLPFIILAVVIGIVWIRIVGRREE